MTQETEILEEKVEDLVDVGIPTSLYGSYQKRTEIDAPEKYVAQLPTRISTRDSYACAE